MAIYTYTGNVDPSDKTGRISLGGGAITVSVGSYADFTSAEYQVLSKRCVLLPGIIGNAQSATVNLSDAASALVSFDFAEIAGHSYAAGGGTQLPGGTSGVTSARGLAYARRFLRAQGVHRVRDMSIGGAIACWPSSLAVGDGGWAWIWQQTFRPPLPTDQPLYPHAPVAIVHYGLNDLAVLGSHSLTPFKEAYRSILASLRLARRYQDSDASCVYAGTWSTLNSTLANSGTGFHYTTTLDDTVTITVPSDYDARAPIDLFITASAAVTLGITVDGVAQPDWVIAAGMWDTNAGTKTNGFVKRLAGFAAGGHTIVVKLKSGGSAWSFDSWGMEAADGPKFIVPMPSRTVDYSLWQTWTHGPGAGADPMSDASIPFLTAAIQAIHGEFDTSQILEVDIDTPLAKTASRFAADKAHPNNEGHRLIADAIRKAWIIRSPKSVQVLDAPPRVSWRQVGGAGGPAFTNSWVVGNTTLEYGWDESGFVHLRGATKNASSGNYNSGHPIFTLPPDMVPPRDHISIISMGSLSATLWVLGQNQGASAGQVSLLVATGATNNAQVVFDGTHFEVA